MTAKFTHKFNLSEVLKYKKIFQRQGQFPAFPQPYTDRIIPIKHTGYLMFVRSKFLYLGLIKSLDDRNLYVSWIILKSYWENVATFGYYYLNISRLLGEHKKEEAYLLSERMALGGRGFLTETMIQNIGRIKDDFKIPRISEMMKVVDQDWRKNLVKEESIMGKLYYEFIAEGGHTTFMGLSISGKWLPDKSQIADVKKSWTREDYKQILNLFIMATAIYFYYWDKFKEL